MQNQNNDFEREQTVQNALMENQDKLYALISMLMVRDAQDALDVLQRTNAAILEHPERHDPSKSLWSWFTGIAMNQVKMYVRSKVHSRVTYDTDLLDTLTAEVNGDRYFHGVELDEYLDALKHCMAKLPPLKRELLQEHYLDNKKITELSASYHLSTASLAKMFYRMRNALQNCILSLIRVRQTTGAVLHGKKPGQGAEENDFISRLSLFLDESLDDGMTDSFVKELAESPEKRAVYMEQSFLNAFIRCRKQNLFLEGERIVPVFRVQTRVAVITAAAIAALLAGGAWLMRTGRSGGKLAHSETTVGNNLSIAFDSGREQSCAAAERRLQPDATEAPPAALASDSIIPSFSADGMVAVPRLQDKEQEMNTALCKAKTLAATSITAVAAATLQNAAMVGTATLAADADATEYTWVSGSTGGWADGASWVGGIAPGSNDTAVLPAGDVCAAADDTNVISILGAITLKDAASHLVFTNDTEMTVPCPVTGAGQILKMGEGCLFLSSTNNRKDYYTASGMVISNGMVKLPVCSEINLLDHVFESIWVYAPGILHTVSTGNTYINNLWGDGTLTNGVAGGPHQLRVMAGPCVFAGKLTGNVRWYSAGKVDLTGTNSDFAGNVAIWRSGTTAVRKIGKKGSPSSIGTSVSIDQRDGFGTSFRYLGDGETTDKAFNFWGPNGKPYQLDAGPNGGVVFSGAWSSTGVSMSQLLLSGTNVSPCVFNGTFSEVSYNSTNYSTRIIKQGSGTWRFESNASRNNKGVVDVREGTLQFDSLAEKGRVCSLGLSTLCMEDYVGLYDTNRVVSYAFSLGYTATTGTLEYIGTSSSTCSTRPLVLAGNGRLVNNGAGFLSFSGVSALTAGTKTLVLAGTNTGINIAANVSDGPGTVSLSKEDIGTWCLDGANTFSGSLDVKAGTLELLSSGAGYSWLRFTVKQTQAIPLNKGDSNVQLNEFALYDGLGVRQNIGLQLTNNLASIQPGQIAYTKQGYAFYTSRDVDKLLDDVAADNGWCVCYSYGIPSLSNPSAWISLVMRLTNGTPAIASYDICSWAGAGNGRELSAYSVEASRDGVWWTTLADQTNVTPPAANCWYSDGSKFVSGKTRTGYAVSYPEYSSGLPNVTRVSVASNATLKAVGNTVSLNTLTVDCAAGGGTLDNFTFAATGKLYLANLPNSRQYMVPVTLTNVSNLANMKKWSLYVNGKLDGNKSIIVHGDKISISMRGTVVMLM